MTIIIDWDEVKSLIKWDYRNNCICCNVKIRMLNNTRCSPCHFSPSSSGRKTASNYFTCGFKPKTIFRQYGVPDTWGKGQLFFFMFRPELNNEFPYPQYIIDIFGNKIMKDNIDWILHHENSKNWDDHLCNLMLCLRHEHSYFEKKNEVFYRSIMKLYKNF